MLRESVKWDYELRNGQQLETVVDRALTIAKSEPMGPVYLSLPREVLSQTMAEFTYTTPSRQHAAAPAFPNGDAVEELAALLADAENPLIITSSAGRDPKAWSALADFSERYAIPVIQYRNRYMSIPSNHPMNLGYEVSPLLERPTSFWRSMSRCHGCRPTTRCATTQKLSTWVPTRYMDTFRFAVTPATSR